MGKHTFRIKQSGIEVYPRMETLAHEGEEHTEARITSGIPGLDTLLGGGMAVGDATVVLGPSGAGKTNFSLNFLQQGLRDKERCLYVSFQESAKQLTREGDRVRLGSELRIGVRPSRDPARSGRRTRP